MENKACICRTVCRAEPRCALTRIGPSTVGRRQSTGEGGGIDSIGSLWLNIMGSVGEYSWSGG